jgi:hypothetical protein
MIKDKKGQMGIMWLFIIMAGILVLGFVISIFVAFAGWTSDVITPVATDLGMIDDYNVSEAGQITFGTLDTIIGMLPMFVGFAYLMLLVGCIVLVLSYRGTQNPLFMGLYLVFTIVIVLTAILASNAYQDLYSGTDEIAVYLQGMTMLSFLILQSPYIFGIVAFICGIFLFSGRQNETFATETGYGGGY